MVRAFAHGAMGFQIDPSWWTHRAISHDWCNKGRGMSYPVYGMVHIKEPLLLIGRSSHVTAAGFLSHYQSGPLPYV